MLQCKIKNCNFSQEICRESDVERAKKQLSVHLTRKHHSTLRVYKKRYALPTDFDYAIALSKAASQSDKISSRDRTNVDKQKSESSVASTSLKKQRRESVKKATVEGDSVKEASDDKKRNSVKERSVKDKRKDSAKEASVKDKRKDSAKEASLKDESGDSAKEASLKDESGDSVKEASMDDDVDDADAISATEDDELVERIELQKSKSDSTESESDLLEIVQNENDSQNIEASDDDSPKIVDVVANANGDSVSIPIEDDDSDNNSGKRAKEKPLSVFKRGDEFEYRCMVKNCHYSSRKKKNPNAALASHLTTHQMTFADYRRQFCLDLDKAMDARSAKDGEKSRQKSIAASRIEKSKTKRARKESQNLASDEKKEIEKTKSEDANEPADKAEIEASRDDDAVVATKQKKRKRRTVTPQKIRQRGVCGVDSFEWNLPYNPLKSRKSVPGAVRQSSRMRSLSKKVEKK